MVEETQRSNSEAAPLRHPWVQMFVFFTVFVVIVLGLLIGYRYGMDTWTNDWYLFHVARHTTWALDKIGHSASLEDVSLPGYGAAEKRATLAAWERGENAAAPDEVAAASRGALTPWECFRYRLGRLQGTHNPAEIRATLAAWEQGKEGPSSQDIAAAPSTPLSAWERFRYRSSRAQREGRSGGPRVWFVLREGVETELRDTNERLRELRDSMEPGSSGPTAEIQSMEAKVAELQTRLQELRTDPKVHAGELGKYFVFIVVPECGAIEVMAIFLAAVVAFPTRLWRKLAGIVLGLPIMYFVNVFRLTCLAVVGAMDSSRDRWVFSFAHEYVWQTVYIVFVVAVWLVWIEYVVRRKA